MLDGVLMGLSAAFTPLNLLVLAAGVLVGVIFGALPGLSGTMAIALFIPVTYGMDVITALLFLVGNYSGSIFGGSITAILLKIPGDPGNAASIFDGHQMALGGEAGKALGLSAMCSCLGGIFSGIILLLVAPQLAKVALSFGAAEYFAVAFMGITAIASLGSGSQIKSLISCFLGLALACIGVDSLTGISRLTFGFRFLYDGIQLIPAMIGLFALSEIFSQIVCKRTVGSLVSEKVNTRLPKFRTLWQHRWLMLKTAVVGTWIGILPGTGATLANFMGYSIALHSSKHPEEFGRGAIDGIIGPETANNAAVGGSFVPTLALGIPGSGAATLLISALTLHGVRVGPMVFSEQPKLAYAIIVGFILTNLIFLVLGIYCTRYFGKLLEIPYFILFPFILILTVVGSFSLRNNPGDVAMMFFVGIAGYFVIDKGGFPAAPIILGFVLGPIMETNFRRAYMISGSYMEMFSRPITAALMLLSLFFLLWPPIKTAVQKHKTNTEEST